MEKGERHQQRRRQKPLYNSTAQPTQHITHSTHTAHPAHAPHTNLELVDAALLVGDGVVARAHLALEAGGVALQAFGRWCVSGVRCVLRVVWGRAFG
jgi:hypothetical protein